MEEEGEGRRGITAWRRRIEARARVVVTAAAASD
jgi:hypothetical protein